MLSFTLTPDLQTRESVMLAAGRVQMALTGHDGLVRYIKVECKRKDVERGGYFRGTVALDDATHVFVSEKGYGTERIGTYYPPKPGKPSGRFFPADQLHHDNAHVMAFQAVVEFANTGSLGRYEAVYSDIKAESQCGLCGRTLEDPISVQRGIGPDCAAKPTGTRILKASAFATEAAQVEDPGNQAEADLAAAEGALGYAVAPNRLMLSMDAMSDAELEGVIAEATRILHKRQFARHEAAQEAQAALAGV